MTKGMDNFPKTMVNIMHLISNYKVPPRLQHAQPSGNAGVAFVQGGSGAKKPAGAATPTAEVVCWHCAQTGHYKSDCPFLKEIDQQHGVQNFSIEECNEGHNLFAADDGWTLVQKGKKGVQGILSRTTCSSTHVQATQVLRTRASLRTSGSKSVASWGIAMLDHAAWTRHVQWVPSKRCGTTRATLPPSCH